MWSSPTKIGSWPRAQKYTRMLVNHCFIKSSVDVKNSICKTQLALCVPVCLLVCCCLSYISCFNWPFNDCPYPIPVTISVVTAKMQNVDQMRWKESKLSLIIISFVLLWRRAEHWKQEEEKHICTWVMAFSRHFFNEKYIFFFLEGFLVVAKYIVNTRFIVKNTDCS